MILFINGGASSGKTTICEKYSRQLGSKLAYLRINNIKPPFSYGRKNAITRNPDVEIVDITKNLDKIILKKHYDVVVLKSLSSLVANELVENNTKYYQLIDKILTGLAAVYSQTEHFIIISDSVFGDARDYDLKTSQYLYCLGRIHIRLSAVSQIVVETVCGLDIILKGKGILA